ncbi:MAG: hypothetical protein LBS50_09345, partial [Prevotellaceae bacterium]|nr:hypothetical protein [Prevotellaceae bacterium]
MKLKPQNIQIYYCSLNISLLRHRDTLRIFPKIWLKKEYKDFSRLSMLCPVIAGFDPQSQYYKNEIA